MSGGVDSAVAAFLMKQSGYDCTGVTMVAGNGAELDRPLCESGLTADADDAKAVCDRLGMKHETVDLRVAFREFVIDDFVNEYKAGRTPNPCVQCNRCIKFGELLRSVEKLDAAKEPGGYVFATGHYARVERSGEADRWLLIKAADDSKDQSYMLYNLTQEQLAYVRFPLGAMTKAETRQIAEDNGFEVAHKHDSQDICFVPDGDYAGFIGSLIGESGEPGDFVDVKTGRVLGRHKGQLHYTTGQRKGLGLALPAPMYVCGKDVDKNIVYLSDNDTLFSRELTADRVNFCSIERPGNNVRIRCEAKIRYAHKPQPAEAYVTDEGLLRVVFDEPQRAVTAGQSVVLYDGDIVLGGGVIL